MWYRSSGLIAVMPGTIRSFSTPTIAKVKNAQSTSCAAMNNTPSFGASLVMPRATKAGAKWPMNTVQANLAAAKLAAAAATAVANAPHAMSATVTVVDQVRIVA